MRLHTQGRILAILPLLLGLLIAPIAAGGPRASAQEATPTTLSCVPQPVATEAPPAATPASVTATAPTGELKKVKMGYVPVSIFAPVFVAKEKGYFAEQGLDVSLEPFPGGSDPVVLTASGQLDLGIGGAGPAFWNAIAQGLPIKVIAPGQAF